MLSSDFATHTNPPLGLVVVLAGSSKKPVMLVTGVVHHEVGHDAHAPAVGLVDQFHSIGQVTVFLKGRTRSRSRQLMS